MRNTGGTDDVPPGKKASLGPAQRRDNAVVTTRNPYMVYRAARANSISPPSTPIPAHIPLADFLPKLHDPSRNDAPSLTTSTLPGYETSPLDPGPPVLPPVAMQLQQRSSDVANQNPLSLRPSPLQTSWATGPKAPRTADAQIMTKLSSLAQDALPRPPTSSTRRPSISSHIDLVEAAARLKRTHSYQGMVHAVESLHGDAVETPGTAGGLADDEITQVGELEPEPVLQIGHYTYIRSDSDDFRISLIRNDGTCYYTATPVARMGSRRFKKHEPRPPAKSIGPYGFSRVHEALFVLVICLSQVLMLVGIAQALVPAKIMGQSFLNTRPGDIAWYSAAYGLTSGTFVLPAGRLGDIFGHSRLFIIGFVWFAAWSLIAGFSEAVQRAGGAGTIFFVVSRAFQGIGPAILVPNGQAMLGRAYAPGTRKNVVMCLFGAAAPFGFVLGAVMSSLFAERASWPWAFWTMAAVCVALAAVSAGILPADAPRDGDQMVLADEDGEDNDDVVTSKAKNRRESLWVRMDAAGMILGVSGLVLINFAFSQAPIVGWTTAYTYFLLIIGLLAMCAFAYVETFQATHPLVPFAAMSASTNFVLGCTATGWGCFSVWVYYAVSTMENIRGWSPLLTSAAFAPAPLSGLAASLLTGVLFSHHVKPHWVMLISMCAFFIGSLLFATGPPGQLYWYNSFFAILIMPFGMDMSNPAATIMLSNSVGKTNQGIAASLVVTVVNYSISLALGISGTVEASVLDTNNLLRGYRAAQYFGLGLGGLGILLATAFLCQNRLRASRASQTPRAEKSTR
ncbi:major facilitator superfamily transporter [Grosmannia clavigera kw1407]|uniref:Major facilitator superfamily transporter n=1 Tax=Grosmannia clavigera (strain kw1407 / UAMH 11150) TaxID=655863 RepID=F0XG15_GROCL|nr:major facilitator superfamily transporter [Grosmannia clavigera kw1407]EFX03361.1 major facilitator superfamily transporter [Grosmannia clavigera kw1407]